MSLLASVFAGALLCNAIPHVTSGLSGATFPTPFARPRGKGPSSPLVNVLWGAFNIVAGGALLIWQPIRIGANADTLALGAGALLLGIFCAVHFGKVRSDGGAG